MTPNKENVPWWTLFNRLKIANFKKWWFFTVVDDTLNDPIERKRFEARFSTVTLVCNMKICAASKLKMQLFIGGSCTLYLNLNNLLSNFCNFLFCISWLNFSNQNNISRGLSSIKVFTSWLRTACWYFLKIEGKALIGQLKIANLLAQYFD